jgi:hypothetical protein
VHVVKLPPSERATKGASAASITRLPAAAGSLAVGVIGLDARNTAEPLGLTDADRCVPCRGEGVRGKASSRSDDFFRVRECEVAGRRRPPQRVAAYAQSGRSIIAGVSGERRRPGTLTANPTAAMYDAVALAGRGCGLMATVDIPAGTVVLQEDPVLVYTTHAARGTVCAVCLRLVDAAQASACACPDCGAMICSPPVSLCGSAARLPGGGCCGREAVR